MALNIDLAPTLHDVVRDPGQQRNLIGTPEGDARVAELRALLEALRRGERFDA